MALPTRSPRDSHSLVAWALLWLRQRARAGDVYSAHPELGGKLKALKLLGKNIEAGGGGGGGGRLVCVGDGKQEEQAAAALGLSFVKVRGLLRP